MQFFVSVIMQERQKQNNLKQNLNNIRTQPRAKLVQHVKYRTMLNEPEFQAPKETETCSFWFSCIQFSPVKNTKNAKRIMILLTLSFRHNKTLLTL